MSNKLATFDNLTQVATHMRNQLTHKKYVLLFAYNGTGKTRLSTEFKNIGKPEPVTELDLEQEAILEEDDRAGDTLYFNAFTEDLFIWDNDLDNDSVRELRINRYSRFFEALDELEIDTRIRKLLHSFNDFDFRIEKREITEKQSQKDALPQSITIEDGRHFVNYVSFSRQVMVGRKQEKRDFIKVSRGEENLFVWCVFLAIAQIALDETEDSTYSWVKYLYIDDPISSLDDNNAIAVASQLCQILKSYNGSIKTVISSHHTLFYNAVCNELKGGLRYMLCSHNGKVKYSLKNTTDTPYFHHVATLKLLDKAARKNELYTYHFSMLRSVLEKSATFHGYNHLSDFVKRNEDDPDSVLHHRLIQLLNHGGYSHFDPVEMVDENKQHFKKILYKFMRDYEFNPAILAVAEESAV